MKLVLIDYDGNQFAGIHALHSIILMFCSVCHLNRRKSSSKRANSGALFHGQACYLLFDVYNGSSILFCIRADNFIRLFILNGAGICPTLKVGFHQSRGKYLISLREAFQCDQVNLYMENSPTRELSFWSGEFSRLFSSPACRFWDKTFYLALCA